MAALSDETPTPEGPAAAARARKRRIALRKKAAASDEVIDGEEGPPSKKARAGEEDSVIDPDTDKPKPSITGIKKQSRYMPGVPMTKEELKEWRKEARRVRNRESAAASRRRNRDRIGELEGELETLNSKYAAALQYIADLEGSCSKDCFTPRILRQDLKGVRGNTGSVPCPEVTFGGTNEAFITNTAPFTFDMKENHFGNVQKKHQHIMAMISRPIACV
eukprot:scaffold5682_cov140-Cylindrotheca_fusiformis.AAC.9